MTKSNLNSWASAPPQWIKPGGDSFDGIVLSSWLSISRNLLGLPFPHHATSSQRKKCFENVFEALKTSVIIEKSKFFQVDQHSDMGRQFLIERNLLDHEQMADNEEMGLVVSAGEDLSVAINEEDHLKATGVLPGLALSESWEKLTQLDDDLATKLALSYNSEWGYMTASPRNMGTGLRASCLLHLPALVLSGKIKDVLKNLDAAGLHARGFYEDGATATGDLFLVSNNRTLGVSDDQIIKDVELGVKELCGLEKSEERNLFESDSKVAVEDQLKQAMGTLQWVRMLTLSEGMKLISLLRWAVKLGKNLPFDLEKITGLFILAQTSHLRVKLGAGGDLSDISVFRVQFLKTELADR